MLYVLENQIAFDSNEIGFPSISSCHALVLHTTAGLYGFHIYGTPKHFHSYTGEDIFDRKTGALKDFLKNHHLSGKHLGFYSVCFREKRGYSAADSWENEVRAYARRVKYKGRIKSYDLGKTGYASSGYVEFRKVGSSIFAYTKDWAEMKDDTVSFDNSLATPNLKLAGAGTANALTTTDKFTKSVNKVSGPDLTRIPDSAFEEVKL